MKKWWVLLLALLLCGVTALAEADDAIVRGEIVDGSYIIHIPDAEGDLGWLADEMAQDDSVVKLASADLIEDEFVIQYDPTGDGDVTVSARHYTGIACDRMYTWDLAVADGAIAEVTGGSYTESPDPCLSDPYLIGEWQTEDGMAAMTIEKNPSGRAWDVEIVGAASHGGWVFKTTIYYDCDLNSFVYGKGKFWDVPITDSEEPAELGEAKLAGTWGTFTFTGDPSDLRLSWYDEERPEEPMDFQREAVTEIYNPEDINAAIALIHAEFDGWGGWEIKSIRYAGDAANNAENIEWLNGLKEKEYAQCMELLMDLHTPADVKGALEPDTDYTDYQWWLARTEGGDWELITWGY